MAGHGLPFAVRLAQGSAQCADPGFDGFQPILTGAHGFGQIAARMLDTGLNQFKQADTAVGQLRHGGVSAGQGVTAGGELFSKCSEAGRNAAFGFAAQINDLCHLAGEVVELGCHCFAVRNQFAAMFFLSPAALLDFAVKVDHLTAEQRDEFSVASFKFGAPLFDLIGKQLIALAHPAVEFFRLAGQFAQPVTGRSHRLFVDRRDLGDGRGQVFFKLCSGGAPGIERFAFAFAQRASNCSAFLAHRAQPRSQRGQRLAFLRVEHFARFFQFGRQSAGPRADCGKRINFLTVELGSELCPTLGQGGKAVFGDGIKLFGLAGKFDKGLLDHFAQRKDLPLTGLAKLVELVEPGDQFIDLGMGGAASSADVVGDVFGRTGNYRQAAAQRFHVFERRGANGLDRIDLCAVVMDQRGELVRMKREPFGGDPAQRIDIARLRGNEFAREAQLAIDRGQPGFEQHRFIAQQPRRLAKAQRFAAAVAHANQPDYGHK